MTADDRSISGMDASNWLLTGQLAVAGQSGAQCSHSHSHFLLLTVWDVPP